MKYLLPFIVICSFAGVSFAQTAPKNFSSFGVGLYRGARPTMENLRYLKSLGVITIVDLQGGDIHDPLLGTVAATLQPGENPEWIASEKAAAEALGMRFVNVPLDSLGFVNAEQARGINEVLQMLSQSENRPVYVHCEYGMDRTGLVVALYRVLGQHWTPERAHQEMVQRGHGQLHQIFTGGMDRYFWSAIKRTTPQ